MRNFGTGMLFASSILLSQWALAQTPESPDKNVMPQSIQQTTNHTLVLVSDIMISSHPKYINYNIPVIMEEPEILSSQKSGFNLGLVGNKVVLWYPFSSKGIIPCSTGTLGIGFGQEVKGDTLNLWGDHIVIQAKINF